MEDSPLIGCLSASGHFPLEFSNQPVIRTHAPTGYVLLHAIYPLGLPHAPLSDCSESNTRWGMNGLSLLDVSFQYIHNIVSSIRYVF